jgi:hypothetical protein
MRRVEEEYFPSGVEWMLPHYDHVCCQGAFLYKR